METYADVEGAVNVQLAIRSLNRKLRQTSKRHVNPSVQEHGMDVESLKPASHQICTVRSYESPKFLSSLDSEVKNSDEEPQCCMCMLLWYSIHLAHMKKL